MFGCGDWRRDGAAVVLAIALAAPAAMAQGKTLIYCSEGSPDAFNPALSTSLTTFDATSRQLFDQLVDFEHGTTTIIPGLAESWEISDDGLEYIFKLREGVKFHSSGAFEPTRDFNADDVIFSFERQGNPEHPYHDVSGGTYEVFNAMSMPDLIERIEKVDDYTVKFMLTRPEAPMIANLGMDFASILSAEYADAMIAAGTPQKLDLEPIGTGPFEFVGYQKDAAIRYRANQDYWRGAPAIDNLVFAITPDAPVRYQKLKAGECHVMSYPNPADIAAMDVDPNITVLEQEGLNIGYLAYNTLIPPFDDPTVRRALNMAIDKDTIVEVVFRGLAMVAKNPIPPIMWSYNEDIEDDPYDPETAKRMLEGAGVTDLKTSIWAMPVQRAYNPNARRMAELIQDDWAQIGVTADIVTYEWGEYLKRSRDIDRPGAVLLGWTGSNGDPDNFLSVMLSCDAVGGVNRAQWCNEEFEALIEAARRETDHETRIELYEEAQVVFKEQAPWATIAHSIAVMPVRQEVKGYKIDPFGGHVFYGVDLEG
ncbi:MAG: ABC transporter substrate-binding protein [Pseudomonadota bacterium]